MPVIVMVVTRAVHVINIPQFLRNTATSFNTKRTNSLLTSKFVSFQHHDNCWQGSTGTLGTVTTTCNVHSCGANNILLLHCWLQQLTNYNTTCKLFSALAPRVLHICYRIGLNMGTMSIVKLPWSNCVGILFHCEALSCMYMQNLQCMFGHITPWPYCILWKCTYMYLCVTPTLTHIHTQTYTHRCFYLHV